MNHSWAVTSETISCRTIISLPYFVFSGRCRARIDETDRTTRLNFNNQCTRLLFSFLFNRLFDGPETVGPLLQCVREHKCFFFRGKRKSKGRIYPHSSVCCSECVCACARTPDKTFKSIRPNGATLSARTYRGPLLEE